MSVFTVVFICLRAYEFFAPVFEIEQSRRSQTAVAPGVIAAEQHADVRGDPSQDDGARAEMRAEMLEHIVSSVNTRREPGLQDEVILLGRPE